MSNTPNDPDFNLNPGDVDDVVTPSTADVPELGDLPDLPDAADLGVDGEMPNVEAGIADIPRVRVPPIDALSTDIPTVPVTEVEAHAARILAADETVAAAAESVAPASTGAVATATSGTVATTAGGTVAAGSAIANSRKLVPGWKATEDDQIVVFGVLAAAALGALTFFGLFRGGDDAVEVASLTTFAQAGELDTSLRSANPTTPIPTTLQIESAAPTAATPTTVVPTTAVPTTAAPTTVEVVDLRPDVLAALTGAGVTGAGATVDGTIATATGVVASEEARDAALAAAAAVPGVTSVIDQLTIEVVDLQPDVLAALTGAGVTGAGATIDGTIATATGVVASEEARDAALAAAAAVPGVTSVIDQLTIEIAIVDQLNALFVLEPIQFATNSSDILEESNGTLDAAVAILENVSDKVRLEVQGYTDVRGNADANLALSEARATSVVTYLLSNGIAGNILSSKGYGETEEFGAGDSDEALKANRRVQFFNLNE